MSEKEYTEMDLKIAEELGGVKAFLAKIDENLNRHCITEERDKQAVWKKIDQHTMDIGNQNGLIKWIIGIGVGLQFAWGVVVTWIKG